MTRLTKRILTMAGAVALAFGIAWHLACENTDPIAPDGATISLTASPDPINLLGGGTTTITARVLSKTGVPVPDGTAVFFETSSGTLSVTSTTTEGGVATTVLTVGSTGSVTVKAFSGGSNASRQITIVNANVANVTLFSPDPTIRQVCVDEIDLNGKVTDSSGQGVPSLQVTIIVDSSTPAGITGNFTGTLTDGGGNYSGTWRISQNDCGTNCDDGGSCTIVLKASVAGNVTSSPLTVQETIP